MGRTGVTVDAAMFATFVRVDGAVETDVRTGVPADERAGVFGTERGAERLDIRIVGGPAVIERLSDTDFVAACRIRFRASSLDRRRHEENMMQQEEQSKNICFEQDNAPACEVR